MKYQAFALLALIVSGLSAHALDTADAATFDRRVITEDEVHFHEDETTLKPTVAFIEVVNYRAMSAPSGARFFMVTLKNQMDGRQVIQPRNFVGIFADGKRVNPSFRSILLESRETRTVVLSFGDYQFPLVKLLIDNES
ncbi:hypothetical protein [Cerasicoccus maritimus]|uniref:hypothetical protein n=1 Tax=Cerasicoccus maritimus TaxID=490089 RepID=UPI00285255D2|nr:hypothetical protein [Cerasicoccus maritimus]